MVIGLSLQGKEHAIVFGAKRITRQIAPLLLVIAGIAFLVDFYFAHTSSYSRCFYALIACAILAPAIQIFGVLQGESKGKMTLLFIDLAVVAIGLTVFFLGEYIAIDLLGIDTVKYAFEPGVSINSVTAITAGCIVASIAFWSTLDKKKAPLVSAD